MSTGMRRSGRDLARRIEGMEDDRHAEVWAGRRSSVDGRVLGRKRAFAQWIVRCNKSDYIRSGL